MYPADQLVTYGHLEPLERWFRQVSDKNPLVLLRNKCDIEHCEFEGNAAIVTQFAMELAAKYHHTVRESSLQRVLCDTVLMLAYPHDSPELTPLTQHKGRDHQRRYQR